MKDIKEGLEIKHKDIEKSLTVLEVRSDEIENDTLVVKNQVGISFTVWTKDCELIK